MHAVLLQVIEARNLAVPSDLLHSFYTMDAYAVVTCSGDGGLSSCQTKVERNNMQPHWNERCSFPDAALGNSVLVALFDHNKLTSDVFLGQVGRPVAWLYTRTAAAVLGWYGAP